MIRLVSSYTDPVLAYAYYGCAIAALVALCFLFVNIAKVITDREERSNFFAASQSKEFKESIC